MSGFVIGSVYAFKTKYKNPFALGLGSGVTIGLLFAQYAGNSNPEIITIACLLIFDLYL
jgi:hypothetical protein